MWICGWKWGVWGSNDHRKGSRLVLIGEYSCVD
jgi:hypothetical protein